MERHEQVALTPGASKSEVKTESWLEEIERKIEGIDTRELAGRTEV